MKQLPFGLALLVTSYLLLTPLDHPPPGPENSDKVVHALLFALLALVGRSGRIPVLPLAIGLAAYAVGTECLQALLPINRHGDAADALADVTGLALGLLAARVSGVGAAPGPRSPR